MKYILCIVFDDWNRPLLCDYCKCTWTVIWFKFCIRFTAKSILQMTSDRYSNTNPMALLAVPNGAIRVKCSWGRKCSISLITGKSLKSLNDCETGTRQSSISLIQKYFQITKSWRVTTLVHALRLFSDGPCLLMIS